MVDRELASSDKAKSDIWDDADAISRAQDGILRRFCGNPRATCRILRFRVRILSESLSSGDSLHPVCSMYVLFGFLQMSFEASQ